MGLNIKKGQSMADSEQKPPINVMDTYHTKILEAWKMVEEEPAFKKIKVKTKTKEGLTEYIDIDLCGRGAFAQDTLKINGILFLGIGASYDNEENKNDNQKRKIDTCTISKDGKVQYESKEGRGEEDDEKGYDYYKPMSDIAKITEFGSNWSNVDITLFRETNQDILEPLFKNFPDIMKEQLKLAIKMITDANPKIIVVSNAFVRRVLRKEIKLKKEYKDFVLSDFNFEFSNVYGTSIITSPDELKGKPVFFTSILHGAGTLDTGSRERLEWHIKYVKRLLEQ